MYKVSSGPSVYPQEVLKKIAQGVINWEGKNISTLEIGHRTELFFTVLEELKTRTQKLLNVPEDYTILYLQGGGRLHFAQIPMNFLQPDEKVQIIDTGYWSTKAAEYASAYGGVEKIVSSSDSHHTAIPHADCSNLDGRYLQYCANNTIQGTQFRTLPKSNIPVVVDMSSDIFSRVFDWSNIGVMLACAQKNFGPAGLSLLIIKNDFLATAKNDLPAVLSYKNLASKNSNYNTPPIFQLFASLEMMKWIEEKGGVSVLEKETTERAAMLYTAIDQSELVENKIDKADRSTVNIVFDAKTEDVAKELRSKFEAAHIIGFKGHKARGGFRIGNYIAQSREAIEVVASLL